MTTCGCQQPAVDLAHGAFVRPRFFAGQLLTEDDLEALGGYLTAKNRLHNRYLFGAGVVCGLQVGCHPCGGGTVRAMPGYALDCCGNDIVVDCPRELDVNALIRDLRIRTLGEDCGDPCAEPDNTADAGSNGGAAGGSDENDRPAPTASRHYCLYVRYVEELVEPVAPYATEEPCGHQTCEPTRVREGYRFLLRCEQAEPLVDDLWARLAACFPTYRDRATAAAVGRLAMLADPMTLAARTGDAPIAFAAAPDTERLVARLDALTASLAEVRTGGSEPPTGDTARQMTDDLRALAATVARFDVQDDDTRAQLLADHPDLTRVEQARDVLTAAAARLRDAVESTWSERLDREVATAALDQAERVGAGQTDQLGRPETLMLAQGLPWSTGAQAALAGGAAALKEWLLDRLDAADWLTDCELRTMVAAIEVPAGGDLREVTLGSTGTSAQQLTEALRRYLVDCLCSALNPPCPPCDDQDVLLACVEVRDCTVVRVCNASREHVMSGSALTYWLPIRRLEQLVEAWCCAPPAVRRPKRKPQLQPGAPAGPPEPVLFTVTPQVFGPAPPGWVPRELLGPLAAFGLRLPDLERLFAPDVGAAGPLREIDARLTGLAERFGQARGQLTAARGLITKLGNRLSALEHGGT